MIKISRGTLYKGLAVAAGLPLAISGLHVLGTGDEARASTPTTVLDWNAERQHVDGFGGSFAFHKAGSIQRLGEPLSSEILDMIFNTEDGIGLDIVRVMVGDGGIDEWGDDIYDGPTETIMPEPGQLVWEQDDWEEQKDDFDAYQIWLMQEAQQRGVETFMASVWSPPAWMKENQSVIGSWWGGNNRLDPEMYQEFADYLAEYVLGYKEHFGIEITHISPTNEPDFSGGYSSSTWTPGELNTFVRDYLGPTFDERGVEAEIVLGEGMAFDEEYAAEALADPVTVDYVDIVAAHAYIGLQQGGTMPAPDAFEVSNDLGKTIWQTEYMNQGEPQDRVFENTTISDGLRYANLIGNMFDVSHLNGYFWWWPASNSGADGSNLIRLMNDGSPQGGNPTETGEYRVFKRYYTFGNYSRFIEPGYVMLDSDTRPADDVLATAYKDPASDDFAVVVVNNAESEQTLTFELTDFPGAETLVPYRTSASENQRKLDGVSVDDGTVTVDLRAESVTTLVPDYAALPELPDRKDVFSTYEPAESDGMTPGLQIRDNPERGDVLSNIRHGSHVAWDNVNFADGSAAGFLDQKGELQMHAHVASMQGGTIEVRLGSPTGTLVGEMEVPAADDPRQCRHPWKDDCADSWVTVSTDIDTSPGAAREFQDMYLVFDGGHSSANNKMFHVDYFEFSD